MGKISCFSIELTDNKVVYTAGETISGNVIIEATDSVDFKTIEVKFGGRSYVHWTEQRSNGNNQYTEHYSAKEKYFKNTIDLVTAGKHGQSSQLQAGRHVFPFQFQLPPNLPTSIEVRGGWVRYSIKGKIDRSGLFADYRTRLMFTVLDVLDLNYFSNAKLPSAASDTKTLCCWCCASGPIEGKVNSDKTGYVPGEFITVRGSIENKSATNLPGSSFAVIQHITQHSTRKSRSFPVTMTKVSSSPCSSRSSVYLGPHQLQGDMRPMYRFRYAFIVYCRLLKHNLQVTAYEANQTQSLKRLTCYSQLRDEELLTAIPAVPPSHLRFCSIIDVEYFVQLCVDTPTCHINLRVLAPLEIGTVPLLADDTSSAPPPINTSETTFLPGSTSASSELPPVYQPPPPSYAAATEVTLPQKDFEGPSTYAPQYNYYDWSQSAFTYN